MMIEVIDQYGERHRFDDNHCIHDADSATGMVQIGVSNDSGDYDVVATFFHPARFGAVSDDTCFTLRAVPAGIARQIEELRAENEKLKADAKYGWQAQELILKNQALKTELAKEREKVKALEATWIGYNKLQEQLAAAQATIVEMQDKFISIQEYWNRDRNEMAMADACEHAIKTACDALDLPTNRDALNEMLARECERLAEEYPVDMLSTQLIEEAAAHRARKEVK